MESTPTDTWTVTNRAGTEIARVGAQTMEIARFEASRIPAVAAWSASDGGFALRRLRSDELS